MNLKKMGRYLRVNLLGPGPRLMKKEFTSPRSHKGWETPLQKTLPPTALAHVSKVSNSCIKENDVQNIQVLNLTDWLILVQGVPPSGLPSPPFPVFTSRASRLRNRQCSHPLFAQLWPMMLSEVELGYRHSDLHNGIINMSVVTYIERFCMSVKLGRWHWGRKGSWGCLRTWCWGEYLDLGVTR